MFTGIIEATGIISSVSGEGTNMTFQIISALAPELKVDQSLSHDGVCLTVEGVTEHTYQVTAIAETLSKTALSTLETGRQGKSRKMPSDEWPVGRSYGSGSCGLYMRYAWIAMKSRGVGYSVSNSRNHIRNLIIEKGSIAVNGISLTCFEVTNKAFSVAIIPYTFNYTNIRDLFPGSLVNIEFDLIGKYVQRMIGQSRQA